MHAQDYAVTSPPSQGEENHQDDTLEFKSIESEDNRYTLQERLASFKLGSLPKFLPETLSNGLTHSLSHPHLRAMREKDSESANSSSGIRTPNHNGGTPLIKNGGVVQSKSFSFYRTNEAGVSKKVSLEHSDKSNSSKPIIFPSEAKVESQAMEQGISMQPPTSEMTTKAQSSSIAKYENARDPESQPNKITSFAINLEKDKDKNKIKKMGSGRITSKFSFFRRTEMFTKTQSKVIEIIQDKAFITPSDSKYLRKNHTKKDKAPKLLTILKKHANAKMRDSGDGSRLFDALNRLKKKQMNTVEKMKYKLNKFFGKLETPARAVKSLVLYAKKPFVPKGMFILVWEFIIMVLTMIDLVMLPFRFSFSDAFTDWETSFNHFDTFMTVAFLLDILVNFNTAYYLDGNIILKRSKIAVHYIKRWFWIDLICSFPYGWIGDLMQEDEIDSASKGFFRLIKLLRFLKLLRVIRVVKLKRIVGKLQNFLYTSPLINGVISLIELSMIISFLAHWVACGWHYIAINDDEGGWLTHNQLQDAGPKDRYIASLYFAVTTMLTVGYGDIVAIDSDGRIYSIFVMLLGGGVFGYIMNSIASIVHSLEDERSKTRKKISSVVRFMQRRGLAWNLQVEVKKYLEFVLQDDNAVGQNEREMFDSLSLNLRDKVYEQLNGRLLSENKVLLTNFSKKILYSISSKIQERTFAPDEVIFDKKDTEYCLYYVNKGTVEIYIPKRDTALQTLEKGKHFGEVSFFSGMSRDCLAKSLEFSHLLYLKRNALLETFDEDFQQDKEMFCMIRDKILVYQDYSVLHITCPVCQKPDHLYEICPELYHKLDKEAVIQDHLWEVKENMKSHIRRKRLRMSPLRHLDELESKARMILAKYPQQVQDIREGSEINRETEYLDELSPPPLIRKRSSQFRPSFQSKPSTDDMRRLLRSFSKKEQDLVRTSNSRLTLYDPTFGEVEVIVKSDLDLDRRGSVRPGEPIRLNVEEREKIQFDAVCNFQIYFPHNNLTKILDKPKSWGIKEKSHGDEAHKLKRHLKRFFSALERDKEKAKTPKSLNKSAISSMNSYVQKRHESSKIDLTFGI